MSPPRPLTRAALASVAALAAPWLSACGQRDQPTSFTPPPSAKREAVVVHAPEKLTSIETEVKDSAGRPVRVACVTCHSLRDGGTIPTSAADLREFHAGLTFDHGGQACSACHVATPGRAPTLHLADGRQVGTADAMELCAQCHGPQFRNYKRGSHGGMNGYWDLSKGPRLRNHCVDCHDPHVPKFQPSRPVLPPRDRFLSPPEGAEEPTHG